MVDRVLRRFGLASDTRVVLRRDGAAAGLPTGTPISCGELL